jgi:hypothetical protein
MSESVLSAGVPMLASLGYQLPWTPHDLRDHEHDSSKAHTQSYLSSLWENYEQFDEAWRVSGAPLEAGELQSFYLNRRHFQ